jgi:hypothetical protein
LADNLTGLAAVTHAMPDQLAMLVTTAARYNLKSSESFACQINDAAHDLLPFFAHPAT